jgi:hypothetical protein
MALEATKNPGGTTRSPALVCEGLDGCNGAALEDVVALEETRSGSAH